MIKNLKLLRSKKGISQQQLADAFEISQQAVNAYENGANEPDIDMLIRFANFFNVTIDTLVGNPQAVEFDQLNEEEVWHIMNYRRMPKTARNSLDSFLNSILEIDRVDNLNNKSGNYDSDGTGEISETDNKKS